MPPADEVHGKRQVVAGVYVNDVETRVPGTQSGLAMPAAHVRNIPARHGTGLNRIKTVHGAIRDAKHRQARIEVRHIMPAVHQLDRRQGAVLVNPLGHERKTVLITLIPQPGLPVRQDITRGMDITLLRCHDSPTALGFHRAHTGHTVRHGMTHAVAVRHLIETVARSYRTNLHGLEQHVITRIASH